MTPYVPTPRRTIYDYDYIDLDGLTLAAAADKLLNYHTSKDAGPLALVHGEYGWEEKNYLYVRSERPETDKEMECRHSAEARDHERRETSELRLARKLQAKYGVLT